MISALVYCVRHGQTAENLQGIIQGQLDTHLDKLGIEQATAVAHALEEVSFDIAFMSDLARAVDTAEIILQHHTGVPGHKLSLLRERYMGSLQGQPAFRKLKPCPEDKTVETSSAFVERILQFWDQNILPNVKKTSERQLDRSPCILVVSHGAFISTLARALIEHRDIAKAPDAKLSFCPNASITLFDIQVNGRGTLQRFGDTSHLIKPVLEGNADEVNTEDQ